LDEKQVGFTLGSYDADHAVYIDPVYQWHTFYGSTTSEDMARGIAVDSSANVYVAGHSVGTWNGPGNVSPLNAHAGSSNDIVVVKLSRPEPTSGTPFTVQLMLIMLMA